MLKRNYNGIGNDSSFISITESNISRLDSTQNIYLPTEEQIFNAKNHNQNINNYNDDLEFEILNNNLNVLKLSETSAAKLHVKNGIIKISQNDNLNNNNNNNTQCNFIPIGNNSNDKNNSNLSKGQIVNFLIIYLY
jgi:hypothetical protein